MARSHDDELIRIKKREQKPRKEKREKLRPPKKEKNPPKTTNGVTLDFTTEEKPKYSKYYMAVSRRYRLMRYISVILLVAFLLVMLIFFRENITYSNLMYLVRDLDSENELSIGAYSGIEYEKSLSSDFAMFRQRIARGTNGGFTLYSKTGSVDLESADILAAPRLEAGEKYAVLYDAGAKRYSVFTSLAKVLSAESEKEIEDCAVSDSGRYALLTRSDEARYLITVYSSDFKSLTEYYMDRFVVDMALDEKGETIAVASVDITTSSVKCVVTVGKVGSEEKKTLELSGVMPLALEYTENGRIALVCDSAVIFLDGARETARADLEGLSPASFDISGNTVALTLPTNAIGSENLLRVIDTDGKETARAEISGKAVCVTADGEGAVYAVCESEAHRLSLDTKKIKTEKIPYLPSAAIAYPGGVMIFGPESGEVFFDGSES